MTTFNWNDLMATAAEGITPVPGGPYEVQVATAVTKPTSTGKDSIQVRYNIVAGPHMGRIVFNQFSLTLDNPQAMGYFFRNMKAHGLDSNFFATNPSLEQVAASLVGKLVHVNVALENVNGDDRNKLGGFSPSQLTGGTVPAPAPLAPTAAPAFPGAPPMTAPPLAPPVAPPVAAAPPAPPLAPPAPPMAAPMAPPVAPAAPVAPPAPPVAPRQFDPATGMEAVNGAWTWPPEQAAGYSWNGASWVAPQAAPVVTAPPAPPAPPMPPAPPTPSF
jgi:hypothetical protein